METCKSSESLAAVFRFLNKPINSVKNALACSLSLNVVVVVDQLLTEQEGSLLSVQRHGDVDRVKGVLLQINHVQKQRFLIGHVVFDRDAFFARDLHHLVDALAISQQLLHC